MCSVCGRMIRFSAAGTTAAFKSTSGDVVFTANADGTWHLFRKACILVPMSVVSAEGERSCASSSSGVLYDHFLIRRTFSSSDTDRRTFSSSDSGRSRSESYRNSRNSRNIPTLPTVVQVIDGISVKCRSHWSEQDVRRYALLSKLFGEASADSGTVTRCNHHPERAYLTLFQKLTYTSKALLWSLLILPDM